MHLPGIKLLDDGSQVRRGTIGSTLLVGLLVGSADAGEVLWRAASEDNIRHWREAAWLLSRSALLYALLALALLLFFSLVVFAASKLTHRRPPAWCAFAGAVLASVGLPVFAWGNVVGPLHTGSLSLQAVLADAGVFAAVVFVGLLFIIPLNRLTLLRMSGIAGWSLAVTASSLTLLSVPSPSRTKPAHPAPGGPTNLLFIAIDTLRADRLSSYGYHTVTSPAADSLATDGVLYTTCISPSSSTAPAHASLWTGLYPHQHGVRRNGDTLPPEALTLAERLETLGYETVAFATNKMIDARKGFAQGFTYHTTTGAKNFFKEPDFLKATRFQWWHSLKLVSIGDVLRNDDLVTA